MLFQQTSDGIGEVCMWGRHVFMGYLDKQEETMEVIDEEGWLHSGDLGIMDNQGFLYITGRIKGTGVGLCRGLLQTGPSEHFRGWHTSINTGLSSLPGMGVGMGGSHGYTGPPCSAHPSSDLKNSIWPSAGWTWERRPPHP